MAETTTTTVQAPRDESTEVTQPPSRRRGIIIVVVVVLVLVGLGFWWHSTYYEDTDDAQINGHLIQISSRIAGQVIHVDVDENQLVKKGDPIAELDPRDYQVAVENAQAALGQRAGGGCGGECECADYIDQHRQQSEFCRSGCERGDGIDFAGTVAGGGGACAGGPGRGECFEGAAGSGSLQAAGREGRDQQAAVRCGGGGGGCGEGRGRKRACERAGCRGCGACCQ